MLKEMRKCLERLQELYRQDRVKLGVRSMSFFSKQLSHTRAHIEELEHRVVKLQRSIDKLKKKQEPGQNSKKAAYFPPNHAQKDRERLSTKYSVVQDPFERKLPKFVGRWICAGHIGHGMADAALWVQVDQDGIVQRRIVRKDTRITTGELCDATRWAGDPKDASGRVPLEWHCHNKLSSCHEARNIVTALKYEMDVQRSQYRLYTAYCPYGDLGSFIDNYSRGTPEPWVWSVFSALVDCGLLMENGTLNDVPVEGWKKQVVHRDLKPVNVFLDLEDESHWPRYPQPKLGDFGLAFETLQDDELNPQVWTGPGTHGFLPPEQMRFIDSETREPVDAFKLLAHTNVWGVGAIMFSLVQNRVPTSREQPTYLPGQEEFEYSINPYFRHSVTHALLDAIQECLRFDPSTRPTFKELRSRIDSFILEDGRIEFNPKRTYTRNAQKGLQKPSKEYDLIGLPRERYKIGMAFQRLQPCGRQSSDGSQTSGAGALEQYSS